MQTLTVKPTDKFRKDYYSVLGQMGKPHTTRWPSAAMLGFKTRRGTWSYLNATGGCASCFQDLFDTLHKRLWSIANAETVIGSGVITGLEKCRQL